MGTVYLAQDTRLNRQVALKVCHLADSNRLQSAKVDGSPIEAHVAARTIKLEELPLPLGLARRGVKTATVDLSGELSGTVAITSDKGTTRHRIGQVTQLKNLVPQ